MTTAKSIPGLLRKLTDTFRFVLCIEIHAANDPSYHVPGRAMEIASRRRRMQLQRNAKALAAAQSRICKSAEKCVPNSLTGAIERVAQHPNSDGRAVVKHIERMGGELHLLSLLRPLSLRPSVFRLSHF